MYTLAVILFASFSQPLIVAAQDSTPKDTLPQDTVSKDSLLKIHDLPELMPEAPGGMQAFMQWVSRNYEIPMEAVEQGVSGTLRLEFVVERDGTLNNIRVLNDLGYGTGAEAIRVLKQSGKWHPGIANGRTVRVRYTFPLRLTTQ